MSSSWDTDGFFNEDNWKAKPSNRAQAYASAKKKEEEELRLKERKAAEKLLVCTFLLSYPDGFGHASHGLEEEIRKIVDRNGGDGARTKISIYKQNKSGSISDHAPIEFREKRKFAKVVIDPFPLTAGMNLINELNKELETSFSLTSDEARDSFVYFRVIIRREAEINF